MREGKEDPKLRFGEETEARRKVFDAVHRSGRPLLLLTLVLVIWLLTFSMVLLFLLRRLKP